MKKALVSCMAVVSLAGQAFGQSAEEMARKLQDPLANIKAVMTDNDISFNTGNDETSYGFQLQPVYAMPFEKQGFNLINRAVIPIVGAAPASQKPILGEPVRADDRTWGLADASLQFFFSPKSESAWKWGAGPMISLPTHTDSSLEGPGWGGGPIGVLVGNLSEQISSAFLVGHLWGENEDFSLSFLQPILSYNVPSMPGVSITYNNSIAYNWNTSSGNEWTVPLGLAVGKTFALSGGHGIDVSLGYYYNVERPEGAADSIVKWGVTWLFP